MKLLVGWHALFVGVMGGGKKIREIWIKFPDYYKKDCTLFPLQIQLKKRHFLFTLREVGLGIDFSNTTATTNWNRKNITVRPLIIQSESKRSGPFCLIRLQGMATFDDGGY